MRISDWSSDVCSSDLPDLVGQRFHHLPHQRVVAFHEGAVHREITDAGAENGEDGDQHRFADGTLCLEMPAALRLWERRREGEALYPDRNPALFPPGEGPVRCNKSRPCRPPP